MPEISKERVDSVPPSTPVPGDQEHKGIPEQQSKLNKETDPSEDDHANHDDDEHSDLKQEASSLLDDIVNQILSESKPLAIWQLKLRDLRRACLEKYRWPETKLPCRKLESKSFVI